MPATLSNQATVVFNTQFKRHAWLMPWTKVRVKSTFAIRVSFVIKEIEKEFKQWQLIYEIHKSNERHDQMWTFERGSLLLLLAIIMTYPWKYNVFWRLMCSKETLNFTFLLEKLYLTRCVTATRMLIKWYANFANIGGGLIPFPPNIHFRRSISFSTNSFFACLEINEA